MSQSRAWVTVGAGALSVGVLGSGTAARGDVGQLNQGSIVNWGYSSGSACPVGDTFTQVAGQLHSLALKSDGSVVGWGSNGRGQIDVPVGNSFTQIAAGDLHSLALKSDGTLAGWGHDDYGQSTVPVESTFTQISAGASDSVALKSDGSLVGWGYNGLGQSTVPAGNTFTQVAAGGSHGLALKSDGTLTGWGWNADGQATVPAGNNFTQVAGGGYFSLALKCDGSLAGWGKNDYGQTNAPAGNSFIQVAAGSAHGLALKSDGSVVAWGDDIFGKVSKKPTSGFFLAVAAGGSRSVALKARNEFQDLQIKDVDRFTRNDTLLQRFVSASGNVSIMDDIDWVAPQGTLTVGGDVIIEQGSELNVLLGSAQPNFGQSYHLFNLAHPIQGQFAALHLPALTGDLTWDSTHLYDQGLLQITPEPASGLLLAAGGLGLLARRRRTAQ